MQMVSTREGLQSCTNRLEQYCWLPQLFCSAHWCGRKRQQQRWFQEKRRNRCRRRRFVCKTSPATNRISNAPARTAPVGFLSAASRIAQSGRATTITQGEANADHRVSLLGFGVACVFET